MNIAIVGSRLFTDKKLMRDTFISLLNDYDPFTVVSGGARGADTMAETIAQELYLPTPIIHKADWKRYGRGAGLMRNHLIVDDADMLVAFYGPTGKTNGTENSVQLAQDKGIPIEVYYQRREDE